MRRHIGWKAMRYLQGRGEGEPTYIAPVRFQTGPTGYVVPAPASPQKAAPLVGPTPQTQVRQVRAHAHPGYCTCRGCSQTGR